MALCAISTSDKSALGYAFTYTSLSAFLAARVVGTLTGPEIAEIFPDDFGNGVGVISEGVITITGAITTVNNNVIIRPSASGKHNGTTGSGIKITRSGGYDFTLKIQQDFTLIDGLEIEGVGYEAYAVYVNKQSIIDNCICTQVGATSTNINRSGTVTLSNSTIQNSLVLGGINGIKSTYYQGGVKAYNCTVKGQVVSGIQGDLSSYMVVKNCVALNSQYTFMGRDAIGFSATSSNNATDVSNQYSNGIDNLVGISLTDGVDFTAPSVNDYSVATSSQLIDAGTDLSAQFTTDIVGTVRG